MFRITLIIGCIMVWISATIGQTRKVERLLRAVHEAGGEAQKLEALLSLCEEQYSISTDSLLQYALEAHELAARLADAEGASKANHKVAFALMKKGGVDSAMWIVEQEMQRNPVNDKRTRSIYFDFAILKAQLHNSQGNIQATTGALYDVLKDADQYRDTTAIISARNGLGSVNVQLNKPDEALIFLKKAVHIAWPRFQERLGSVYSNMALAYDRLGQPDSAFYYIDQSIALCRENEMLIFLANALGSKSNFLIKANRLQQAEKALQEAINIRARMKDEQTFSNDQVRLATFYLNTEQPEKGIAACEASLAITDPPYLRLQLYQTLAFCYKAAGRDKDYQETLEQIIILKDSVAAINSAEAIAEIQTKYEVQQKENTIVQQQLALAQQNNQILLVLGGLIIVVLASVLLFNLYRRHHKLRIAKAEENERKRISSDLHDNLGAYAASIASNINQIQAPIGDPQSATALRELQLNANTMMTELNNTIWVLKHEDLSLTAISDRLKLVIQRLAPSYPHIDMGVTERIEQDHVLPSYQAFHLFRIIQEGMNNALVHSACSTLTLHIDTNGTWEIRIVDDGKGIDIQRGKTSTFGGNGLGNMRRRTEQCGWQIAWGENQPHGTVVCITTTN